jgi:hypothetical protein
MALALWQWSEYGAFSISWHLSALSLMLILANSMPSIAMGG